MPKHDATSALISYDEDYHAWVLGQIALLEDGRFSALDVANLVEESNALASAYRHAIESRLGVLLLHFVEVALAPGQKNGKLGTFHYRATFADCAAVEGEPQPEIVSGRDSQKRNTGSRAARPRPKPGSRFPPFPRSVRSQASRCLILTSCRNGGRPRKEEPRRRKREGRPRLNAGTLGGPCRAPQV
jgi:hypothetical protein